MSRLNLTQVGRVAVSVADTDRAIDFYVRKLGFEKVVDLPMGPTRAGSRSPSEARRRQSRSRRRRRAGRRAVPKRGSSSTPPTSMPTMPRSARRASTSTREVSRWGGQIPPMFWLRDPDGNSLCIVQPAA